MASFITSGTILFLICTAIHDTSAKAIGESNQFPYTVGIFLTKGDQHMIVCSGTIIRERHILTSGFCGKNVERDLDNAIAVLGSSNGEEFQMKIDKVKLHPWFFENTLKNDLSILRTEQEIHYSETIQPIALPMLDLENDDGVSAVVSAWDFLEVSIFIK